MNKEFVVVAYPIGRVGSSATMGLLNILGYDLGPEEVSEIKGPDNPRGYFESRHLNELQKSIFSGIYGEVTMPPPIDSYFELIEKGFKSYSSMIFDQYTENKKYCIKSQWSLSLGFWKKMQSDIKCKYIFLTRDVEEQAESLIRVWSQSENRRRYANTDFVIPWLESWNLWCQQLLKELKIPYYELSYENLINDGLESTKLLAAYLDCSAASPSDIKKWLVKN